jgi:hypothetical protein
MSLDQVNAALDNADTTIREIEEAGNAKAYADARAEYGRLLKVRAKALETRNNRK